MAGQKTFDFSLVSFEPESASTPRGLSVSGKLSIPETTAPSRLATVTFEIRGPIADLKLPTAVAGVAAVRRDELWKTTCFEVFYTAARTSYFEHNFAATGDWAAYQFTDFRSGMTIPKTLAPQFVAGEITADLARYTFKFELLRVQASQYFALTCVLENARGELSYWALSHHGERPDFHLRASFILPAE